MWVWIAGSVWDWAGASGAVRPSQGSIDSLNPGLGAGHSGWLIAWFIDRLANGLGQGLGECGADCVADSTENVPALVELFGAWLLVS